MRFDWIHKDVSLEELVASLSEGRCPRCTVRLIQQPMFEDLDPEPEGCFARGGCPACHHWMRAGHGGSNPERDWFSVTMLSTEGDFEGATLTMSLNPPSDDDDEYDDDWDDEPFEDY